MKGELKINGKDAYETWGVSLEDGSVSTLMTPSGVKDFINNTSRLEDGKRVMISDPKVESRELVLEMHLCAETKEAFLNKYANFCNDVLYTGIVDIQTVYQPGIEYHCIYGSCSQFGQYQFGLAKFSLKLTEYNPKDRKIVNKP